MSRYFSFLRKKRSPSLTDDAGESIGPHSSGKLRNLKGKKRLPQNVDDGFCDQRLSLQNYDFYDPESDDVKVSSEGNSIHSDNDSLLDNLSYGEVCSSEGDKSLHWEKVDVLTDDSRPSSSSESPRLDSNSDSVTLCSNKININAQDEDEGLANEGSEDYFSFDQKHLVEQVSLPEPTEMDAGSHLIDDFMDEAFNDLESIEEEFPSSLITIATMSYRPDDVESENLENDVGVEGKLEASKVQRVDSSMSSEELENETNNQGSSSVTNKTDDDCLFDEERQIDLLVSNALSEAKTTSCSEATEASSELKVGLIDADKDKSQASLQHNLLKLAKAEIVEVDLKFENVDILPNMSSHQPLNEMDMKEITNIPVLIDPILSQSDNSIKEMFEVSPVTSEPIDNYLVAQNDYIAINNACPSSNCIVKITFPDNSDDNDIHFDSNNITIQSDEASGSTDEIIGSTDDATANSSTDKSKDSANEAKGSTDEANDFTDQANDFTDHAKGSTDEANNSIVEAKDSADKANGSADEANGSAGIAYGSAEEAKVSNNEANGSTDEENCFTDETSDSTDEASDSTDKASDSTDKASDSTDKASDSTDKANGSTEEANGSTEEANGSTEEANGSTEEAKVSTDKAKVSTDKANGSTDKVNGSTDKANGSTGEAKGSSDESNGFTNEAKGPNIEVNGSDNKANNSIDEAHESADETKCSTDETRGSTDKAKCFTDYARDSTDYARDSTDYAKDSTDYAKESTDYAKDSTDYAKDSTDYAKDSTDYAKDSTDYAKYSTDYAKDSTDEAKDSADEAKDSTDETNGSTYVVNSNEIEISNDNIEVNKKSLVIKMDFVDDEQKVSCVADEAVEDIKVVPIYETEELHEILKVTESGMGTCSVHGPVSLSDDEVIEIRCIDPILEDAVEYLNSDVTTEDVQECEMGGTKEIILVYETGIECANSCLSDEKINEENNTLLDTGTSINILPCDVMSFEVKEHRDTIYAQQAVSFEGSETEFCTNEAKDCGNSQANISVHIEDSSESHFEDSESNLPMSEREDNLNQNADRPNLLESNVVRNESQSLSDTIKDKDISKPPLATLFPVKQRHKDVCDNIERATISVSTGTFSEYEDEFDSAKEDFSDDDAEVERMVPKSLTKDLTKQEEPLYEAVSNDVFCPVKATELPNLVSTFVKMDEFSTFDYKLEAPNREKGGVLQINSNDNSACLVIADSCDNILVSVSGTSNINSISDQSANLKTEDSIVASFMAKEDSVKCVSQTPESAVATSVQNNNESFDAKVQSTTSSVVGSPIENVIICDVPNSFNSSRTNAVAKESDITEGSFGCHNAISRVDRSLPDKECSSPGDLRTNKNTSKAVKEEFDCMDKTKADNDCKSAYPSSNDNSSASNVSNKQCSVSSEEQSLFGHSAFVEAEARLAQRRAARAEARELRLRELEKQQQLDQDDEDEQQYAANSYAPADKKLQNSAAPAPRTNTPYISKSSPRGVSNTRASAGRSSLANSTSSPGPFSRRSSEDSLPDDALPLSSRELKAELKELEEKFRKAMITNAQLDNEKATLTYEVEFLKDKYSDLEETHNQLTKDHRKKCSENETLRKLTNKLKDEVNMVRKVLQERDSLIQEYGLVLIGEENGEDDFEEHDAEMEDDTINDLSPRKIGVKKALLSMEASELLARGAAQGSLDVRLKKYAERKNDLEDEVRRLKLELEEELSKRRKENGLDYEKQKEASKSINEYKFRVQKAEAEVSTLQANVARLESLVSRYKASTEELEKSEEDLKSEKRKLQRELREAQNRLEELELTTSHLQKRFDKLKTARSTLLKDLSMDPV